MMAKKPAESRDCAAFEHAPHIVWRRVDQEAVLLDTETSEYYSLNPVSTEIWERLGKGETVGDVALSLSSDFGEDEARVARDAREFISDLLKEGLLLPREPER